MTKSLFEMSSASVAAMREKGRFLDSKVSDKTKSIAGRSNTLVADIHAVAFAALHYAAHTSVCDEGACNGEPARKLVVAVGTGIRAKTLVDWFHAHSNVRLRMDKNKAWTVKMVGPNHEGFLDKDATVAAMQAGWDKPFYSVEEKTSGAKAFDLGAAMASMLARAAKELGENDPKVVFLADWAKANAPAPVKPAKVAVAA